MLIAVEEETTVPEPSIAAQLGPSPQQTRAGKVTSARAKISRRHVLSGAAAALALPIVAPARADATWLRDLLPGWMTVRLAVPNTPSRTGRYADYTALARHAHRFVSENLTKTAFTLFDHPTGPVTDFSMFFAQRQALITAGAVMPEFDLHGAFWHGSMSPALEGRLLQQPATWPDLVDRIIETQIETGLFPRFDINEMQRAYTRQDAENNFWRSGADAKRKGSRWYEAAQAAPWPHGAGYWWLRAAQRAKDSAAHVIYQDFDLEAGRPWGSTAHLPVPAGFESQLSELQKRRRVLDAVNYALVHDGRVDVLGLQAHLAPWRAIDETDLGFWLEGLEAMGVVPEITEFDVRQSRADRPGAPPPDRYAAYVVSFILAHTRLTQIGGWTGWAPPNQPPRHTLVDRNGVTTLGAAIADVAAQGTDPATRQFAVPCRFYHLCFGLTGDLWRAARAPDHPGFDSDGNARGTRVLRGSGGACLPLSNRNAKPGKSVAPVWRTAGSSVLNDLDPQSFSLSFQWETDDQPGPILALGPADGPPQLTVVQELGRMVVVRTGAGATLLGVADGVLSLSFAGGRVTCATAPGGPVSAVDWTGDAGRLILLGDGTHETVRRATCLRLWPGPARDAATLTARCQPLGAQIRSADEMA